jgi:hypothetical protein
LDNIRDKKVVGVFVRFRGASGVILNWLLIHGVIAQVPFVDVATTMLDETIPLTTGEYDEWEIKC